MEKAVLHPYLMFEGNCREAMEFYKGIFGGELNMMTFGQVDDSCPAAIRDHIMHASLMGGEIDFMGCDTPKPGPLGATRSSSPSAVSMKPVSAANSRGSAKVAPLPYPWKNRHGATFSAHSKTSTGSTG